MTACTQPGCGGTIEDGYCNVCGMAPAPASTGSVGTAAALSTGAGQPVTPSKFGRPSRLSSASSTGSASSVSSASGSSTSWSSASGSRRGRSGSGRSTRGRLGAGLVAVPPVPSRDPATAVLASPLVPENRRFCGKCERPVGRGTDGRPGRTDGFCPHCGTRFSFDPRLEPGELVAGQYEVLGCLAHGGLGWIYLARDHNLGNRWVVLKGLLNTGDAYALDAAVAERRFLAEVEHPNIVGVYNFVQHADRRTGEKAGYIVMEYVGGQSLLHILKEHRAAGQSLPLPTALAYAIEVLPALGYLHARGLIYCDFKPDNVIQTEEQIKLIDMGAVRRADDADSPIYGTVGYQAPEIEEAGPSPASDLYTVGRALAVLTFEFTGYQSTYKYTLPDPAGIPVLAGNDSYLRALRRATDRDPDRRFESASEMAEQLTGVLREVLSVADGQPRPAFSALFSPEIQAIGAPGLEHADGAPVLAVPSPHEIATGLPVPVVDSDDPAAGYLATLSTLDPGQRIAALTAAMQGENGVPEAVARSVETRFTLARAHIAGGDPAIALQLLASSEIGPLDWRVPWYQGLAALATGDPGSAYVVFDDVLTALPGELAPKLALGLAAEAAADPRTAAHFLHVIRAVDRSFVSATFGLARVQLAQGDRSQAVATLDTVPATSSQYLAAQVAAIRLRLAPLTDQSWPSADDLQAADQKLSLLKLDPGVRQRLTAEVLQAALNRVLAGQPLAGGLLLGSEPHERALRLGLETSYRAQARLAPDAGRRIHLVDRANEVRPRTWS